MDYQHLYYLSRKEEFKARYREKHPIKPKKKKVPKLLNLQLEIRRVALKTKMENIKKIQTPEIILKDDVKINFD